MTDEESGRCPVRNVLANVNGKWAYLILLSLEDGPQRFNAIKRLVGDISQRVLTENLRSLERDGLITRSIKEGPPLAVYYALTELGRDLVGHLIPLVLWAEKKFDEVMACRAAYDARTP